jgi:hypothetical protein
VSAPSPMPSRVASLQRAGLVSAVAGLGVSAALGFGNPTQFLRSYLVAYLFWVGLAIGCLSVSMIHHLTGGIWGLVIRRILEAGTRTFPLLALLFLPIAFGLGRLYPWAHPGAAEADALLRHKAPYLNTTFFLVRAAFYFVVWMVVAFVMNKWSLALDAGPDRAISRRLRGLGGVGLILLGSTITFSSIDWAMSLDPHWFSTIYGVLFMIGQALSALSFVIVCIAVLGSEKPLSDVVRPGAVHDLGKLLLAFVMLWTYMNLSQFLIMWSGNLPEEIPWYIRRFHGGWQVVGLILVLFHFLLPFLLLLSRDLKRNARLLGFVAGGILVARILDLYWLVAPDLAGHGADAHGLVLHALDLALPIGIGGLWLAVFTFELRKRPMIPVGDPEIRELLDQASGLAR